jgi:hypothetical protein
LPVDSDGLMTASPMFFAAQEQYALPNCLVELNANFLINGGKLTVRFLKLRVTGLGTVQRAMNDRSKVLYT